MERKGEKKKKAQLTEKEDISLLNCWFVFSSDTLENMHQILFLYFPLLHVHFHSHLEVKKYFASCILL